MQVLAQTLSRGDIHKWVSVLVDGDALPTEFRLFVAGINETEKGPFIFDELSAESVMAAYGAHGVDRMIDLEHLSLDEDSPSFDPDARGWCKLEIRNGELWAVNVTWTAEGAERIRSKRQRYISPAFLTDNEGRITKIVNIALTAMPATHRTPALIAAGQRKSQMDPKKLAAAIMSLRALGRSDEQIMQTLAIDIKTLQAVVKAIGGDPSGDLGTLMSTVAKFAADLAAMASGEVAPASSDEPAAMADTASGEPPVEDPAKMSNRDELARLRAEKLAADKARDAELKTLRQEKADREAKDHRALVGQIVVLGGLTPAMAWEDAEATKPSSMLRKLSIADLEGWVRRLGGSPHVGAAPEPPRSEGVVMSGSGDVEISEYEAKRVAVAARENKVDEVKALEAYRACKLQGFLGAKTPEAQKLRGRKIEQAHVIASVTGRVGMEDVRRLTNAVRPIEKYGPTSQRAMEEFIVSYMIGVATAAPTWVGDLGDIMPSGALDITYPLDFSAVQYQERLGQNSAAETPQAAELNIKKREFRASKMGNLRRINDGDFAYLNSWSQGGAQFGRARVLNQAKLVVTLLEAGTSDYWGQTTLQATGIDGQPFFSASHKVHPYNPKMKLHGSATWGNYQASATPLTAGNLTQEKASMLNVPYFDGQELGTRATGMLIPTSLDEIARLLLTVQDVILDANASLKSVSNTFGAVRNEHFNSGFERTWAPQLTGSGDTANWYEYSRETIGMGFVPWVVAEDASEEILQWDESSDFYKDTGFIKVESKIFTNATLVWPHGIRYIKGT